MKNSNTLFMTIGYGIMCGLLIIGKLCFGMSKIQLNNVRDKGTVIFS